ncbi:hypothetical protein [Hymenobacter crusticola]|uniref:Uncharacterized protein n=1 Tax=Hymenobacter crusticola TaxID=1770526 RepID=A0A243W8H7_9BACT|nr:hypothetical protein [Hymenobacter crusticola]OUJ71232.1 hypothetical protein BXP70_22400 [Hymenobacter crusticola]
MSTPDLKLLLTTPNVSAYYDSSNDWLYLNWHGELDLDRLRKSCLQIVLCLVARRYKRILNDNTDLTKATPDVVPWLATELLPYMKLVGIEYMAWILSPNLDVQNEAEAALEEITKPVVAVFEDMASAYEWLSSVNFQPPGMLTSSGGLDQIMSVLKNRIMHLGGKMW